MYDGWFGRSQEAAYKEVHTSMSGNLAISPVIGSRGMEELNLAKASLVAREGPACKPRRGAARRKARREVDMVVSRDDESQKSTRSGRRKATSCRR